MNERLRSAECVICHGGAGVISAAIRAGRRPMAMPRRVALAEHTDDHQLQIVDKLASLGLVVPLQSRIDAAHVRAARQSPPAEPPLEGADMVEAMRSAVASALRRRRRRRMGRRARQTAGRSK
jgi:UDP-N-acetylglucosamine transferase subunit ALG13